MLSADLDLYQSHFPEKILGKPLVQTVVNLAFVEVVLNEMESFKSIRVDSSSPVDTVMGPNGLFRHVMDFYKKIKFPKLRYNFFLHSLFF